jgi:hypothetical protein
MNIHKELFCLLQSSNKKLQIYGTLYSQPWIHKNSLEELFESPSSDQKPSRTSK